uniref:site-2 protease family protein n=1 Tax=uncultured Micrococcus sp. TaxID=114051 RepID=UPI0026257081|nr:site-2 protease family protein [uncultured Micrococcus sp.]
MTRRPGLPIGRAAGAPVYLSWTWALVAAFVVLTFGPQIQRALPHLGAGAYAVALGYAVLLALSVLAHEIAHAVVGRAFGDRAEEIVLTLWGGHTQFRGPQAGPWGTVATAMAGPLANLAVAGLAWLAALTLPTASVAGLLLDITVWANLLLAAFNALPGMPLDGGRLVESAVWASTGSRDRGLVAAGWSGRAIAVLLVGAALAGPLLRGQRSDLLMSLLLAWVGVILWRGAGASVERGRWGGRLAVLTLASLEIPAVAVPAEGSVAHALRLADGGRRAAVAVDATGTPRGVLDLTAVVHRPADELERTPVSAACTALAPGTVVRRADLPASGADLVARLGEPDLPVRVLTDARDGVASVLPRDTLLAAVHATRHSTDDPSAKENRA